ncbi:MAG: hypothetical protein DWQ47_14375 [Acidobacteria bacterium]|nr:MAG: hypothetical protein DWQ32_01775 [Acidobacteriota bacterium]REK02745.1 MAG: hypothetical protein DWQ38_10360 [Acidobacteriota bacterium]REK13450.1 MAG: hypothetical protein DWQ43_07465 [Acidobacteriota bacterium]REK41444.1 MAG: hypothetical protein DWQ47_14375 [Acidobacteriota bacterium]
MGKFLIGAILGALIGGALTFYFFVGVPSAGEVPGEPVQAPDADGPKAGTATIVLREEFFNVVLSTIFEEMQAPKFPLRSSLEVPRPISGELISSQNGQNCEDNITLLPEGSGVKTGVTLEEGKLTAPMAFKGSANVLGSCYSFSGWSKSDLNLNFDSETGNVYGKINVQTVNLDGMTPLASGLIAQFVQGALNQRVNPITLIEGKQVAVDLPIEASGGNLTAKITDVRAEVKDKALNLNVTYDFEGSGSSGTEN